MATSDKRNNNGHGGRRTNAGRKARQELHLKLAQARQLHSLTKYRRNLGNQGLTEEQVVSDLVAAEWAKILESFEEAAQEAQEPYIV